MGLKSVTPEESITVFESSRSPDSEAERLLAPPKVPKLTTPIIDKESLRKKLEEIPTETLRSILMNQVDLEIRLKHRELRLTEEEIGKCEAQMLALRKFFDVPNDVNFSSEPNDFTLKYYDVLNKSLSVSYTKLQQQLYHEAPKFNESVFETAPSEPSHYRTRSTTSSLRPSITGPGLRVAGCLYRRTDGIIVKLTCPDCQRSNFSSAQGFLNHSRIAHSKEFTSQDAAALQCGEILPDDFQDEEGIASLKNLRLKEIDPSKNLNVKEIYFDGLSSALNTAHRPSSEIGAPPANFSQVVSSTEDKGFHRTRPSLGEGNSELMKKLIKNGVTQDAEEYRELVEQALQDVPQAHLFEGEADVESDTDITPRSNTPIGSHAASRKNSQSAQSVVLKPSEKQTSRRGIVKQESQDTMEAARSPRHSETGGKYENRLRRRKSRSFADLEGIRGRGREDEEDVPKRRKR